MFYRVYKYAVWVVTVIAVAMWWRSDSLHVVDLPLVLFAVSLLYLPMLYRVGRRSWLHRRQAELGLPAATDSELLAFLSEELDAARIDWEWRAAPYGARLWDAIAIGPDDDPIFVKAHDGVVEVEWGGAEMDAFLDPNAALDFVCTLKGVAPPQDEDLFGEDAGTAVP